MVQRLVSTLFLTAFVCNALVASVGGQLICSHFDGKGHVVEVAVHERETLQFDCHETRHEPANSPLPYQTDSHASHTPHCDDEEYLDPDLGSQLSGKDRLILKSVVIGEAACVSDKNALVSNGRLGLAVPIESPDSEGPGQHFARIIRLLR